MRERQPHIDVSFPLFLLPLPCLKKKIFLNAIPFKWTWKNPNLGGGREHTCLHCNLSALTPYSYFQIFPSCFWSFYYQSAISFCLTSSLRTPIAVPSFSKAVLSQGHNGEQREGTQVSNNCVPTMFSFHFHKECLAGCLPSPSDPFSRQIAEDCPVSQVSLFPLPFLHKSHYLDVYSWDRKSFYIRKIPLPHREALCLYHAKPYLDLPTPQYWLWALSFIHKRPINMWNGNTEIDFMLFCIN